MSALIDSLKSQHVQILKYLEKAKDLGIATEEGKASLLQGKHIILAHLQKEDEELYPKLCEHERTKAISDRFSSEMKDLVNLAVQLFTDVENGKKNMETAKLLGKVVASLKMRISSEENSLYPVYKEVSA